MTLRMLLGGGVPALAAGFLALSATGCLDRPLCSENCRPETINVFVSRVPTGRIDKIDLVFMIDNSISMADKQELLRRAVPSLMSRFVTPLCVDGAGVPNGARATGGVCSSGAPEFPPMQDIHIAVISSSLGAAGSEACTTQVSFGNDRALPVALVRPNSALSSWNGSGFLAWDPSGDRNVPAGTRMQDVLEQDFQNHVVAVSENGCGFEASLESWYRFLISPDPPASVTFDGQRTVMEGVDTDVVAARDRFLRSDSLVVIVMLSDENDCSFSPHGVGGAFTNHLVRMPRGTSVCATDPASPCCRSCNTIEDTPPTGCGRLADDVECRKGTFTADEDPMGTRCSNQKRRYGIDLLEPIGKYVSGLTSPVVPDRNGVMHPNPLFVGRNGKPQRETNLVFLAGIVGVPWQDIATADSLTGPGLRYLTAQELAAQKRWDVILGNPPTFRPPTDPHMIESVPPRSGNHPFLPNAAIAPPNAPAPTTDPISGHEQIPPRNNDLQYACIFELETPRVCDSMNQNCDCASAEEVAANRPLCRPPAGGPPGNTQYYAKAYPGTRQLEVLRGIGDQGIVASICPKNPRSASPESDANYGYNPAVNALVDQLRAPLANQCLGRAPAIAGDGSLSCAVVEAEFSGSCVCNKPGRREPRRGVIDGVRRDLEQAGLCDAETRPACSTVCGCEIAEATGDALTACRSPADPAGQAPGYCYVDPSAGLGSPELVSGCPETKQRLLRFVGPDTPTNGTIAFMTCLGETLRE